MMRFAFLLFALFLPAMCHALEITGLRIEPNDHGEHITLRLTAHASPSVFHVQNPPPRIVVDVPDALIRGHLALPRPYRGRVVKAMRAGFHDARTVRLVFDLAEDAAIRNVAMIESKHEYSLEFDLTPREHGVVSKPARPEPRAAAPLPVIVIDAGHGGQDPGTSGHAGTLEKNQTLRYALALKAALLRTGRYRPFLTREDDRYLFLRDRVQRARAAKGDLFISLHADSAPTRAARGLSVYTISETASDKESAALAAKENKADVIGGMDLSDTSQDVADILIDLTQRETRARSAKFADLAVKCLGREVNLLSNTHRFAGFAVLKAPDIPSILIEIGFLTTPREEQLIKSDAYENHVIHAIVTAIDRYYGHGGR